MKKNKMTAPQVVSLLQSLANPTVAAQTQKFFKIGPSHYTSPQDKFIGIPVPVLRKHIKNIQLEFSCLEKLINHRVHEIRLFSVLYLVKIYQQKSKQNLFAKSIVTFYLKNFNGVNNWDLVDSSAYQILGHYLYHVVSAPKQETILLKLAKSKNLWKQRLAIVSTYYFIKQGSYEHTLRLAERYLDHEHDLIHKATGWMLREVGKQDKSTLIQFLNQHVKNMPRVMFRYSVELLPRGSVIELATCSAVDKKVS